MKNSDIDLVQIAREAPVGDLRAFDELVRRHQVKVKTNCRYLSGNEDDALDLAQEILVKAYFNLDRFEDRSSFGTWIKRIKVNHCLNHLRSRDRYRHVDVEEPALESDVALHSRFAAESDTEAGEIRARITRILDGMPESLRVPLILRDMDGMTYQEIAAHLGIGLSAVKMRIKRARELFRAEFGLVP